MTRVAPQPATFVRRENRFVVVAELGDGRRVRAYLPNTGRLADLLVTGASLLVSADDAPRRRTGFTVTRVWDGAWVAVDAAAAARLVAEELEAGGALPGWPATRSVQREVAHAGQRFDLAVELVDGRHALVEVKSLTTARGEVAPLSSTPSSRGTRHLETLAGLAADGGLVAAVFVVQRGDVAVLDLDAPADPAWVRAVRRARAAGVNVVAFRAEVDDRRIGLGPAIPVRDRPTAIGREPLSPPVDGGGGRA